MRLKYLLLGALAAGLALPALADSTLVASSILPIKNGGGYLLDVYAESATAGVLVVIDSPTPPNSGDTLKPIECVSVSANGTGGVNYQSAPEYFGTGITAVFSSGGCYLYTPVSAFIHGRGR